MVPTIQKPEKMAALIWTVLYIIFLKQSRLMNHLKSGPFKKQTKIDHLKSEYVQISDPHCTSLYDGPFNDRTVWSLWSLYRTGP